MEALKKILKLIEDAYAQLQQAVSSNQALVASNKNKEVELSELIDENKKASQNLGEREKAVTDREKKVSQLNDYAAAIKTLDEDQKENRRKSALLEERQKTHDKKVSDENAELDRKRTKLNTEREAFDNEKKDWKEKMSKKIIDDYVTERLRG